MAEKAPQNFANHARLDPPFHFFLLPVAAVTIGQSIYALVRTIIQGDFHFMVAWNVVLSFAFAVAVLKIRLYALKAQDRVIRLEERLRLTNLASEPLRSRIGELSEGQLIALRFASDEEVCQLAMKALADKTPPREIKKAIKTWRGDYWRV